MVYNKQHDEFSVEYFEERLAKLETENESLKQQLADLKPIEKEQRERETRYRQLVELMPGVVWEIDLIGELKFVNRAASDNLGYTQEEFLSGLNVLDILIPEDRERARQNLSNVAAGKEPGPVEFTLLTNENRRIPVLVHSVPIEQDGEIVGYRGLLLDITERKHAEETLRKSEMVSRSLLEGSPVCNKIISLDGKLRYMSSAGIDQLKIPNIDSFYGESYPSVLYPKSIRAPLVAGLKLALGGEKNTVEAPIPDVDGKNVWYDTTFVPVCDNDGNIDHIIATSVNIAERKRAEEERRQIEIQMQQTQKLESLGVMAGGIAHDFNNILQAILGYADLSLMKSPTEASNRHYLQEIRTAALRASGLTNQMLAYAGKGTMLIENVDLSKLVSEMAHLLEVSHSKNAIVTYQFDENILPIKGDPAQLRQVVMNLITNASEAIDDADGTIKIETGLVELSQEYLATTYVTNSLSGGRYAYLTISDTGCGMDEETQRRIFEPFFTTKFTGRGLGMAAVIGILSSHNGAIDITSEPGGGTSIRVVFPALDQQEVEAVAPEREREQVWSGGTILVVDDEPQIREFTRLVLESNEFTVLTAEDGCKAVELFTQHSLDIDCVLLDLTIPHKGGRETFAEIRQIRDDVPVVLVSGYSEEKLVEHVESSGFTDFLKKPVQVQELLDKVRAVLNA